MPIPFTDLESVKKVMKYRKQGLSYNEIARKMSNHKKTIIRWYYVGIGKRKARLGGKLSTPKLAGGK